MVHDTLLIDNPHLQLSFAGDGSCWRYRAASSKSAISITLPVFEIDGKSCALQLEALAPAAPERQLSNGVREYRFAGCVRAHPDMTLEFIVRVAVGNPVVRFRYVLSTTGTHTLTKSAGGDALTYLTTSIPQQADLTEVQFSVFNELVHSYCLQENRLDERVFAAGLSLMGPMLVWQEGGQAVMLAYEHGSQVPDAFLAFHCSPAREVRLQAVKGNYAHGQLLDAGHPYDTIWFQLAAQPGSEAELASAYRQFVLRHQSENMASRRPYIFYNTWAYQERNQAWNGQQFLTSMTQQRMLAEIDIAHRMGIEVFVIDTGWYQKTGDWQVNLARFPDGLRAVKEKLDGYGMKLGLWFSPTQAAVSSAVAQSHQDCLMSWHGEIRGPYPVWETEESYSICLVSRYRDAFADELIRLAHELGVSYFKWDAIGQYGCDDPGHAHGTPVNSAEERAECYAFQLGCDMAYVVDRLCAACPEAIVDFDVTEGGRCVGLGFLAAGKYFLINNGPYYGNYDIPGQVGNWCNIFVHPGAARGWICRTPLSFDTWLPSVLFLTHYLPDDPADSQYLNIASLILGQNGIWGDLLQLSEEGIARFASLLGLYKQVREAITDSDPRVTGMVGGSPEIHEKIARANGQGVVSVFANAVGHYRYVTAHKTAAGVWASEGVTVSHDVQGHAVLDFTFSARGAQIVFFGVQEKEISRAAEPVVSL